MIEAALCLARLRPAYKLLRTQILPVLPELLTALLSVGLVRADSFASVLMPLLRHATFSRTTLLYPPTTMRILGGGQNSGTRKTHVENVAASSAFPRGGEQEQLGELTL